MNFIGCRQKTFIDVDAIVSFQEIGHAGEPMVEIVDCNNRVHVFDGTVIQLLEIVNRTVGEF